MSEENTVDTAAVEREAREAGWRPQAEFRGDPEKWVDAQTFMQRSEHVLPIVKATNDRLRNELTGLRGELQKVTTALGEATDTIDALKTYHEENVKERVTAARANLKKELADATREGRHEDAADLTDKLTQLNTAEADAKAGEKPGDKPGEKPGEKWTPPPELSNWLTTNDWYGKDVRRTALMNGVVAEMRQKGDTRVGTEFLNAAATEVERTLNPRQAPAGGKAEESRGGATGGGGNGAGKRYTDLPAEAKATCERQAVRMVGTNRAFKDLAAWRDYYANVYFEGEA